jgi:hypothetical protein
MTSSQNVYEVRPCKDKRDVESIGIVLDAPSDSMKAKLSDMEDNPFNRDI